MEDRVLELYCNITASIMNAGYDLVPSTCVASFLECTVYQARKSIKSLVNQGYLESACESVYDDYGEKHMPVRGYRLTKQGRESRQYMVAQWSEAKLCSRVWGSGSPYDYFKSWRNSTSGIEEVTDEET